MWQFEKATKKGNEITVTLKRDYKDDEGNPQAERQELTWGYTKDMGSASQFKDMIKRETRYMLDHLNRQAKEEDVTAELSV